MKKRKVISIIYTIFMIVVTTAALASYIYLYNCPTSRINRSIGCILMMCYLGLMGYLAAFINWYHTKD